MPGADTPTRSSIASARAAASARTVRVVSPISSTEGMPRRAASSATAQICPTHRSIRATAQAGFGSGDASIQNSADIHSSIEKRSPPIRSASSAA